MKAEREHRAVERELGRKLLRDSYEGKDGDFPEYEKVISCLNMTIRTIRRFSSQLFDLKLRYKNLF